MHRKLWINGCVAVLVMIMGGVMGCSTYKGIKPIHPAHEAMVSTLQPVLQWKALSDAAVTYDIIIYERLEGKEVNKKEVYYRENIQGAGHTVGIPLQPDTTYLWSVRTRKGKDVGKWSKLQTEVFTGISYHKKTRLFEFTSPSK